MGHTKESLRQYQLLPLGQKIAIAERRIETFYNHFNGQVYISFSGGKDSTVLLDIARKLYPNIKAVFCDTGLEYPQIRDFVKACENVEWIKPEMTFKQVLEREGFPVISKEVSEAVHGAREYKKNGKYKYFYDKLIGEKKDKNGSKSQFNCERWNFLIDAPFKISNKCCNIMKKKPFHKYEKQTGLKAITGQTAQESRLRMQKWLQNGCNSFDSANPISNPLSVWTENDILQYIYENKLPIASVYGNIINKGYEKDMFGNDIGEYETTGVKRTGCMFCMFGVHLEKYPNRFQLMKQTHPIQYKYCMEKLGLKEVLDFIKVEYE